MKNKINLEMNIVKAIGITLIVAGHTKWSVFGDFFICNSFHVPLFFFVSGYFCNFDFTKTDELIKSFFKYIKKVIIKYWSRYYVYHIFYAGIFLLVLNLFNRKYGIMPTWENIFLTPIYITPFSFDAPNWFLYQLPISLILFVLLMKIIKIFTKNNYLALCIFLPLAILSIALAPEKMQPAQLWTKVTIKTLISVFYIYAGYLYKNNLETKVKFDTKTLAFVFLTQIILIAFVSKIGIDIHRGVLPHNIAPLIAPFTGIYFTIFLAKLITPIVKENSFIHQIGKNTLHIMANHLFAFFIIELIVLSLTNQTLNVLPKKLISTTYKCAQLKYLYTFGSIILCTYVGIFLNNTGKYIKLKLKL